MPNPPDDRRIAVLAPLESSYGRGIAAGVSRYAHEIGWMTSLDGGGGPGLERQLDLGVSGVIAFARNGSDIAARGAKSNAAGIPVINISGLGYPGLLPSVLPDDAAIGALAADHLLDQGHHTFAYHGIAGHGYSLRRGDGFIAALAGKTGKVLTHGHAESDTQTFETWLHQLPKPCAVFCCNDQRARATVDTVRRLGMRIPDDVAVVGVDNDDMWSQMTHPPISSVDPDATQVGRTAARVLFARLELGLQPDMLTLVPPKGLLVRASSDRLAIADPDISRAIALLRERAESPGSLDRLLATLPVSRRTLERHVRHALGRTVAEEVMRIRLERFRRLLLERPAATVGSLAESSGFATAQHAIQRFRERYGATPGDYRKRIGTG